MKEGNNKSNSIRLLITNAKSVYIISFICLALIVFIIIFKLIIWRFANIVCPTENILSISSLDYTVDERKMQCASGAGDIIRYELFVKKGPKGTSIRIFGADSVSPEVKWIGDKALQIRILAISDIYRSLHNVDDVKIEYRTVDSLRPHELQLDINAALNSVDPRTPPAIKQQLAQLYKQQYDSFVDWYHANIGE